MIVNIRGHPSADEGKYPAPVNRDIAHQAVQHVVDGALMEYARNLADHYNERIEMFHPDLDKHPDDGLDNLLYDMVMVNAND